MLDLFIDQIPDAKRLVFVDVSEYSVEPQNPTLEITPPGYAKIAVPFAPRVANVYTTQSLGISNSIVTLPDGIYHVKYSIQPNDMKYIERQFLRTYNLMCEYERAYLGLTIMCPCSEASSSKLRTNLNNISLLINGAVAYANQGDAVSAMKLYDKAKCLLSDLPKCNC